MTLNSDPVTTAAVHDGELERASRSPAPWIFAWAAAILPLLGWWAYGLLDMDEGFYGSVVAEMNRRGAWITPYYNGHPWFEKPILLYWLAKPCMALLGQQIGPRLPSILATVGTYALIAWFARRRWGDEAARWCMLVAASCLLIVAVGRMMMTDALLDVCLVGAFTTFWESLVSDRRWRLSSAFFLGLSVLAKGPVGLALFAVIAGWTFWRETELRPAFRGWWGTGTAVLAATIGIWYLPAYLVNGHEFVQKFLIEQNLDRFTGGDPAHTVPFLIGLVMYILVIAVGTAPWSLYLWKAWPRDSDPLHRYLAVWAVVPFVLFAVSKAKLPHYVLPCAPPLALLVGSYQSRRGSGSAGSPTRRLLFPAIACLAVAVVANVGFILYYRRSGQAEIHALAAYVRDHVQPGQDVAAFQMPRRQHDLGTLKPTIQETELPSLSMILNRTVDEPDSMDSLLSDPNGEWVLTRKGRVTPADVDAAHKVSREFSPHATPVAQNGYRLFYLSPALGIRERR
ncbi:MAG TPA: glycosyltransferase family 39 protein [Fimbriimonadaceae bacterium]|nr:glycosyltransferase family 39 protein [Fimbriimonadaceae bacterium]